MFSKIAYMTSVLTVISVSAMAQENLVPRTIPLNEKPAAPHRTINTSDQTTMGTPAGTGLTPSTPTPAPVYSSSGSPSFSSGGNVPVFTSGTTGLNAPPIFNSADSQATPQQKAEDRADKNELNEDRVTKEFDAADTNHDGTVNEAEFSIEYKTQPENPEFNRYDQDDDGMITRQEFTAGNTVGNTITTPKDPEKP